MRSEWKGLVTALKNNKVNLETYKVSCYSIRYK